MKATRAVPALALLVAVAACGHSPASQAAVSPSPSPTPAGGSISGRVAYPSEFIAAQAVYAVAVDGTRFASVDTVWGQDGYTLASVPAGDYYVLTAFRDTGWPVAGDRLRTSRSSRFDAGYTKAVPCGLSNTCTDHSLVPVHVDAGSALTGIDPTDWYAPPNSYPVIPGSGPSAVQPGQQSTNFATSTAAAKYFAPVSMNARLVDTGSLCPDNVACVWLIASHLRTDADYLDGEAGSNGHVEHCAFYLLHTSAGWQPFDRRCAAPGSPFPVVHANGQVSLGKEGPGCVNVHESQSLKSRVVACLPDATRVTIDDGPDYVAESSGASPVEWPESLNYWWHATGKGWVVHRHLYPAA